MDLTWHKACESSACAEVAFTSRVVLLRSTRRRHVAVALTYDEWEHLVAAVRRGEFDRAAP